MAELDIKQIMQEIKEDALSRMPELKKLPEIFTQNCKMSFDSEYTSNEHSSDLLLLNQFWQVSIDRPLVRQGGLKGLIKYLCKKNCRKMIRWYMAPVIEELNENSSINVNLHNQTLLLLEEQKREIEHIKLVVVNLQNNMKP